MTHYIYHYLCILLFLLGSQTACTTQAFAQKSYSITDSGNGCLYGHIRPFSLLFGVAGGLEYQLRQKVSLATNLEGNFWGLPQQIAISPLVKYYFTGRVANGFYGRLKVIGGRFLYPSAIAEQLYYAGSGIGIGWMYRLPKLSGWHFCIDTGLQIVRPFGKTYTHSQPIDNNEYYMVVFLSPSGPFDLSFSFAYSF